MPAFVDHTSVGFIFSTCVFFDITKIPIAQNDAYPALLFSQIIQWETNKNDVCDLDDMRDHNKNAMISSWALPRVSLTPRHSRRKVCVMNQYLPPGVHHVVFETYSPLMSSLFPVFGSPIFFVLPFSKRRFTQFAIPSRVTPKCTARWTSLPTTLWYFQFSS